MINTPIRIIPRYFLPSSWERCGHTAERWCPFWSLLARLQFRCYWNSCYCGCSRRCNLCGRHGCSRGCCSHGNNRRGSPNHGCNCRCYSRGNSRRCSHCRSCHRGYNHGYNCYYSHGYCSCGGCCSRLSADSHRLCGCCRRCGWSRSCCCGCGLRADRPHPQQRPRDR